MIRSLASAVILAGTMAAVPLGAAMAGERDEAGRTCAPRAEIVKLLTDRYREEPSGTGVSESGDAAFEMFLSSAGSWTITMTTTNGLTCVMAAGRDWRDRERVALLPRT